MMGVNRDNKSMMARSQANNTRMGFENSFDVCSTPGGGARAPQRFPKNRNGRPTSSSPERALAAVDTPAEFNYEFDFDEGGALYFLGSSGRRKLWQNPHSTAHVQAFASSIGAGKIEDFVGRIASNCRTHNEPYSYFGIDLGKDRGLVPTIYTIRNRISTTHVLMNWVFEASNDKVNWFELDRRNYMTGRQEEDAMLEQEAKKLREKGAASSWAIDTDIYREIGYEGFRYFRIMQITKNSSGSDNLALAGFELYGRVTKGRWP